MGIDLTPAPRSLALASPILGPWFSTNLELAAPDADLAVPLTIGSDVDWLPPTLGLLSIAIATAARPPVLGRLRKADGGAAFTDGNLVGLFRLLPEVEERLDALARYLPSLTGATAGTAPTRARVRWLALERPAATVSAINTMLGTSASPTDTPRDQARQLGLDLRGEQLVNDTTPMSDLKRPGRIALAGMPLGQSDKLMSIASGTAAKLWAFDARGRAIDPGAVAAWWHHLATTAINNLWAENVDARTTGTAAALTLQLVNAHEGALDETMLGQVTTTGYEGTTALRRRSSGTGGRVSAPSASDATPFARLALLPDGTYGTEVTLWSSGAVGSITRDFARVSVVEVESHLVGRTRSASPDQARVSTRVQVARSDETSLLTTIDATAAAMLGVFDGDGETQLVAPTIDRDWGPFPELRSEDLPDVDAPTLLPTLSATEPQALAATNGTVGRVFALGPDRALLELELGAALAGAWVRAWPLGFDADRAQRVRLDGGAGRANTEGRVRLAMTLPPGPSSGTAPARLGVDVQVTTRRGSRRFEDLRFVRPVGPFGGTPAVDIASESEVIVCETGAPIGSGVPSGATLVAPPRAGRDGWVEIARTSLRTSDLGPDTLAQKLTTAGRSRVIALTQPAFRNTPTGDDTRLSTVSGVSASDLYLWRVERNGTQRIGSGDAVMASAPLPGQERLEVACARAHTSGAVAVVGSAPPLARHHEHGAARAGHPGVPAGVEVHGTGARVTGPAALLVAEYLRDRTAHGGPSRWIPTTAALVAAAWTDFPSQTTPTTPGPWAAALKTVAADVEGELLLGAGIRAANTGGTIFDTAASVVSAVSSVTGAFGGPLPPSAFRALARRCHAATYGAREAHVSLTAAFERAEDLVYLETPAFDVKAIGTAGDVLWDALGRRMDARPGLAVVICLPRRLVPGTPTLIERARDELVARALFRLVSGGTGRADRVAIFSPSAGVGRSMRLASTTVVVDDVYALTGTTHLWRRGLTFDSSLALALFDERLTAGRPRSVRDFRRELVAARLGLTVGQVPDDGLELVDAVRTLLARGGGGRVVVDPAPQDSAPPPADASLGNTDIFNPDGSGASGFNPGTWLLGLVGNAMLAGDVTRP